MINAETKKKARGKASHLQDDDLIIKMTRGLDTLRMVEERGIDEDWNELSP